MNPQDTPHNSWCTVEKLHYLWISCSPAQKPTVQLMFMNLSISENKLFREHLRWFATILTRISDKVTPYINTRYMAPPTETDKKCFYIRQWYRLAKIPSFLLKRRGNYIILKCLNDVNYQVKEVSKEKESMVHYDRLKPFRKQPPTKDIPTREKTPETSTSTSNVPTRNRTLSSLTPQNDTDHTYCTEWPSLLTLQQFSPSIAMPFSGSNHPIPCPTPAIATPPMGIVTVPHTPASTLPYAQTSEQSTPITPPKTELVFLPAHMFLKDCQIKRFSQAPQQANLVDVLANEKSSSKPLQSFALLHKHHKNIERRENRRFNSVGHNPYLCQTCRQIFLISIPLIVRAK